MTTKRLWFLAILLGLSSAFVIVTVVNTKEQIIVEVPIVIEDEVPETITKTYTSALELSEGFYAISINVSSDARGVAGYILPGSMIDVYSFMVEMEELSEETSVEYELLLENVKVLAAQNIAMEVYQEDELQPNLTYTNLTLELTKDQVGSIIGSQDKTYYAVLRYYEVKIEEEVNDGE